MSTQSEAEKLGLLCVNGLPCVPCSFCFQEDEEYDYRTQTFHCSVCSAEEHNYCACCWFKGNLAQAEKFALTIDDEFRPYMNSIITTWKKQDEPEKKHYICPKCHSGTPTKEDILSIAWRSSGISSPHEWAKYMRSESRRVQVAVPPLRNGVLRSPVAVKVDSGFIADEEEEEESMSESSSEEDDYKQYLRFRKAAKEEEKKKKKKKRAQSSDDEEKKKKKKKKKRIVQSSDEDDEEERRFYTPQKPSGNKKFKLVLDSESDPDD